MNDYILVFLLVYNLEATKNEYDEYGLKMNIFFIKSLKFKNMTQK